LLGIAAPQLPKGMTIAEAVFMPLSAAANFIAAQLIKMSAWTAEKSAIASH
jgi:hypothetical protein